MIWSQYQEVLEKLSFEKGKRDFWEAWKPGISEFLVKERPGHRQEQGVTSKAKCQKERMSASYLALHSSPSFFSIIWQRQVFFYDTYFKSLKIILLS